MNLENDMTDESLADATDFGEPDPREQKPFWKRELLMGYSLPWILGGYFWPWQVLDICSVRPCRL